MGVFLQRKEKICIEIKSKTSAKREENLYENTV